MYTINNKQSTNSTSFKEVLLGAKGNIIACQTIYNFYSFCSKSHRIYFSVNLTKRTDFRSYSLFLKAVQPRDSLL